MNKSIFPVIAFFSILFISLSTSNAQAQTLTIPATSSTGTFTISYSVSPGGGIVQEFQANNWVQVGGGSGSGSFALTRTNGSYSYRLQQCYTGPCTTVKTASITVSISSASSSSASISIPATIQVPSNDVDGEFSVQWSAVTGASFYILEQLKSGGSYSETYRGNETIYGALTDPGNYKFQVKACRSSSDCSGYRESTFVTVVGSTPSATRRVVFLHTDLLGSPVAETKEDGKENE